MREPRALPHYARSPYHRAAMAAVAQVAALPRLRPAAYPMPDEPNQTLPARGLIEIKLSLPVGSWVWAFSASSTETAGFECQVIDLRENAPFWGSPANWENVSGQGTTAGITAPLFVLPAPRLVIEPAILSVKLRNLAAAANTVQLVAFVMEPEDAIW